MKYKTFEKKKIYRGMAELRGYEIDTLIRNKMGARIVYDGKVMRLTPTQLKNEKIFINVQQSVIREGQTYAMYGFRWKPTEQLEEQVPIAFDTKVKLSELWKKVKEEKGL